MFDKMKVATRLLLLAGVLIVFLLTLGALGVTGMQGANQGMETVYKDRVVPLKDLKLIADRYAVNIVDASHKVRIGAFSWQDGQRSVQQGRGRYSRRLDGLRLNPDGQRGAGAGRRTQAAA